MNKSIFLCFISLLFIGCTTANKNYNDINPQREFTPISSNWEFRQVGGDKWHSASVPGVVHTDLLKNGVIEHPYYSTNETKLQWIEREQWEYKTTFSVTIEQLAAASLNMVFKGIDTYAEVYLNDEKIIDADNMFVEWKADVKSIIKEGDNQLRVLFKSAYDEGLKRMDGYPKLPADNDKGEIKTSVFSRKAQYHYGWDWGPRFVTAGLWKGVYLECSPATVIDDVWYVQKFQSDSLAQFTANISIHSISNDKINIVVQNENGDVYAQKDGVELVAGENIINMPFEIKNPQLWWPNGMGKEKPKLYSVVAAIVSVKDKSLLDKKIHRLGVRTIELVREPDQWGESFFFKVNGVPLFMKGANIIPQDVFLTEVTAERQRKLVDVAVESNMNMLRIWGGGIYEADELYDYCDENGILLWQDFPFACSFYPWDDRFFESVRLEARQNIRRLRNHPSLAIWCGNNEVDEAWHRWGYTNDSKNYPWSEQDKIDIRKGIDDLFFDDVIPGVVKAEDPHRPYHPSSPMFGWGDKRSQTHGDVHYWGVFHGEEPFSVYKDKPGRFSNEYGHQSFANYDTWRKWLKEEEIEYLSEAFKIHQKNPKG